MEIYRVNPERKCIKVKNLVKALGLNLNKTQTIAFVGAGGKTTSIYQLAEELALLGKRVIITTTTHMLQPERFPVLEENKDMVQKELDLFHTPVVGVPCENGKISGVSNSFYQWMKSESDYILVEADGSKSLPIKVPNETEPVLPEDTDMVIVVAGISCLFQPILDTCHRGSLASSILGCELSYKLGTKDVAKLIEAGYGRKLKKPYKILINQCDSKKQQKYGLEIADYLKEESVILCGR